MNVDVLGSKNECVACSCQCCTSKANESSTYFFSVVSARPDDFQTLLSLQLHNGNIQNLIEYDHIGMLRIVVRLRYICYTLIKSTLDDCFWLSCGGVGRGESKFQWIMFEVISYSMCHLRESA